MMYIRQCAQLFHLHHYIHFASRIFFLSLLILVMGNARGQTFEWAKQMGGGTSDYGHGVAVDGSGSVYITGMSDSKALLARYDADGNLLWAKQVGGNNDYGQAVAVDDSGNVYMIGYFYSDTLDFDPSASTGKLINSSVGGKADVFLAKYNAEGNYLWVKNIGGSDDDQGFGVAVDESDNVYVTGYFHSDTLDFNPGSSTGKLINSSVGGKADVFLAKYAASGNLLWAKNIGGSGTDQGSGIAIDGSSNVYVSGFIQSDTADFNPGGSGGKLNTVGGGDAFLAKYDADGNFLWAKAMGGDATDQSGAIAVDESGNAYVTGLFMSAIADFESGGSGGSIVNRGVANIFLSKYDANGNFLWAKSLGGSFMDLGSGIAVEDNGSVYITGMFMSDTSDFNPDGSGGRLTRMGTYGSGDAFLAKYDAGGNFLWVKSYGGNGDQSGYGIAVDGVGQIYSTGRFSNSVTFDSASQNVLISNGGSLADIYLIKLLNFSGCVNGSSFAYTTCSHYNFGGVNHTESGIYTDTFTNSLGCDSIAILNLTVLDTVWNVFTEVSCDSFTFNGVAYTTSGSYSWAYTGSRGCDSIVLLDLTINKSYHQSDTETLCGGYVFLGQFLSESGVYSDTFKTAAGCDSILTLNLTVHKPSDTTLTIYACDSFMLNDSIYTIRGTYTQVLSNGSGCDSTITLHLTIGGSPQAHVVQNGAVLTANGGNYYQWLNCDSGYALIAGATTATFMPEKTGSYAVVVIADDCSDTSDCYNVEVGGTGIEKLKVYNKIEFYPNPVKSVLHIKADGLEMKSYEVINILGQSMKIGTLSNHNDRIIVDNLETGTYYVRIDTDKGVIEKPFQVLR